MNETLLRLLFIVVLPLISLSLTAGRKVSLIDDGWSFRTPESAPDGRVRIMFNRAKGTTHLSAVKIRKL